MLCYCIQWSMDTILYLYPVRKTEDYRPEVRYPFLQRWITGGKKRQTLQISRREYFFPDYHLVKVAVAGYEECANIGGSDRKCEKNYEWLEQSLCEKLWELTEDPDHTYIVCREPLSFYFGREFREYLQQGWVEHLLRYGQREDGSLLYPDLLVLGRNVFLPYVVLQYATGLRSVKWYLTDREYREDEDWLAEELEEEYGLIPEVHILCSSREMDRICPQCRKPCLVLDFSAQKKVHGGRLPAGSIWLDFTASEEKERRAAGQCPQIRYFSLKKEWKDPRKALEYLDTISKNGYNNSVD